VVNAWGNGNAEATAARVYTRLRESGFAGNIFHIVPEEKRQAAAAATRSRAWRDGSAGGEAVERFDTVGRMILARRV
jgi:hypothetical protein